MSTTHPQHLHARAALWSLRAVWPRLIAATASAAAANDANGDLYTLQAWRPGSRIHNAASGDALLDAIIRHAGPAARNPYADRLVRAQETLAWAVQVIMGEPAQMGASAIVQLLERLPTMTVPAAGHLAQWVDEQDRLIRKLLGEPDDRQGIPAVECPHCGTAGTLVMRTSAPPAAQVMVCTTGCTCEGPGCGCGMSVTEVGVAHIWARPEIVSAIPS